MLWLSLAAFVYCSFRWYCEEIREKRLRAGRAVQQNIIAQRNSPDEPYLMINDPNDDVPPIVATPALRFAECFSPDEELALESIVGAASLSLDANGVPLKPEDNLCIAEHEYELLVDGLEKPPLESEERLPEHGGLFVADGSATSLDCLEPDGPTKLSDNATELFLVNPEVRLPRTFM